MLPIFFNFPMGSDQNLEKSGGFAWRRGGVLPLLRSGSCRGARRRNSLSTIFQLFLGGEGICQVSCHVSKMSQMSLPSLLSKSTSTATVGSYETLIHSSISSLFTLSSKSIK